MSVGSVQCCGKLSAEEVQDDRRRVKEDKKLKNNNK